MGTHNIPLDPALVTGPPGSEGNMPKIDYAFGNPAFAKRNTHELHLPIQRGLIEDFDQMEHLWQHIFEKELNLDPKNMNILLTDSPLNTKEKK